MLFSWVIIWTLLKNIMAVEEGDGYNFQYKVDSQSDDVHFIHNEDRRGYHTVGSYKVLLPDGRTQVVEYTVLNKDSGYVAKVSYEGVAMRDNPPYKQPARYKGIKREIPAGSYAHTVNIKPYGRNILHHIRQVSDIYTTTYPSDIEHVTVIPSPEYVTIAPKYDKDVESLFEERHQESESIREADIEHVTVIPSPEYVTIAPKYDKDVESLFEERHQESESIREAIKRFESDHRAQSPITNSSSTKNDNGRFTESSEIKQNISFTTVVAETTESFKVIPFPEIVTDAIDYVANEDNSDGHKSSVVAQSEKKFVKQNSVQSFPIENKFIPQKVKKQTKITIHPDKEISNKNGPVGAEQSKSFNVPANVTKMCKINGINQDSNKVQPILDYNFKPIQYKTSLTKALDTKNKALHQTNFTPKSPYSLQTSVNNPNRKPKYNLPHKKHDKHYFPIHFPLVSHTRRRDGFWPPKNENKIKIKKTSKNPISSFMNWFPFKL